MCVAGRCLRWYTQSFYIYGCDEDLPSPLKRNSSGGCTVTFKKRGGIEAAWSMAKTIAKWT